MRDVFFTILAIWVIWRIFSGVNRSRGNVTFNTQNNYTEPKKREGEVSIDNSNTNPPNKKPASQVGEYVDFEEIKND